MTRPHLLVLLLAAQSHGQTLVRLTFDELRAADRGPLAVPFETGGYFGARNVPILANTLGTQALIASVAAPPVALRVMTTSGRNFFTTVAIPGEPEPAFGVIFRFATPVTQFSLWRCGIDLREGERVSHPAWSLYALDEAGVVIDSTEELAFSTDARLDPRRFEVRGASISRVMIASTPATGAMLAFPLLDDIEMLTVPNVGIPGVLAAAGFMMRGQRRRR